MYEEISQFDFNKINSTVGEYVDILVSGVCTDCFIKVQTHKFSPSPKIRFILLGRKLEIGLIDRQPIKMKNFQKISISLRLVIQFKFVNTKKKMNKLINRRTLSSCYVRTHHITRF